MKLRLRILIALLLLGACFLILTGCQRTPALDTASSIRVAQMEQSGILSHDGWWATVAPFSDPTLCSGEVILNTAAPPTPLDSFALWMASPPHREILSHDIAKWGYAQSSAPHAGWYYAVAEVEWPC